MTPDKEELRNKALLLCSIFFLVYCSEDSIYDITSKGWILESGGEGAVCVF